MRDLNVVIVINYLGVYDDMDFLFTVYLFWIVFYLKFVLNKIEIMVLFL